jgi:hypothetical protein
MDVSFILNEPADTLGYRVNGSPLQPLDGSTAGFKNFSLSSASDTFAIVARKTDSVGYSIPTGSTIPASTTGLSQPSIEGGLRLISNDANPLTRFNSPRGVSVSNNPNSPNFGVTYISNSANGAVTARTLGDGIYALNADQTDAYGFGDAASNPVLPDGFPAFVTSSSNSPYRLFTADDGQLYVADWSDANGNLIQVSPDLGAAINVFQGFGGPTVLPPGQNHGSVSASYVEGSLSTNDLVVYTVDEDLTSATLGGSSTTDSNSLWRYNVSGAASAARSSSLISAAVVAVGTLPTNVVPQQVNDALLPIVATDMDRGADGKFYLSQNRSAGTESGLYVVDPAGATIYSSLVASRQLLGDPSAVDILRNLLGIAVSPDQRWMAAILNNSDVTLIPLTDGIPMLEHRLVVDTAPNLIAGRDVAFDAAGNLHYVSSGQGIYRVLAPGGTTFAMTSFNGTSFDFFISEVPEPPTLILLICGSLALASLRRRPTAPAKANDWNGSDNGGHDRCWLGNDFDPGNVEFDLIPR